MAEEEFLVGMVIGMESLIGVFVLILLVMVGDNFASWWKDKAK